MTIFRSTWTVLKNRMAKGILIAGLSANMLICNLLLIRLYLRNGVTDEVSLSEKKLQPIRQALSEFPETAIAYINEERDLDGAERGKDLFFVTYALAPHQLIPCSNDDDECVSTITEFRQKGRSGRIAILRKNANSVSLSFQDLP